MDSRYPSEKCRMEHFGYPHKKLRVTIDALECHFLWKELFMSCLTAIEEIYLDSCFPSCLSVCPAQLR